ncbi:MAG: metallophosphoesterase [bacterium]|nr:metallophosphoesterase [bacterium]
MKKIYVWMLIFGLSLAGCAGFEPEPAWQELPAKTSTEDSKTEERESDASVTVDTTEAIETTEMDESEDANTETETSSENAGETESEEEVLEDEVESQIAIATDLHYLAKELADNGAAFQSMLNKSDGMLTQYCWEITMAFLEQMEKEQPDVLILSGDLTKNGEKKSHEELAKRLRKLEQAGVPVLVIPGNHDINSPHASGYRGDSTYSAQQISAKQFEEIYRDFGYKEARARDPYSLSYVYELNDYTWILMLDSCQYKPENKVGGMIQEGTYEWLEEVLEEAWEEGVRLLPVTHHNLLEQTNASEEFIRNCTIEHDERLIRMWEDNQINLHLSGHLHIQHYEKTENEDAPLYEVVTSSLSIYPCHYGILKIMNYGDMYYHTKCVPVSAWAKEHGKNDYNLLHFEEYAKEFLYDISYWSVYNSLQAHGLTVEQSERMAKLYARLNPNFYAGTIPDEKEEIVTDPAYQMWRDSEYFSEAATTIQTMIEEEDQNYNMLYIPY